jgi:predicted KAP-like P-loop ATPase
VNPVDLVGLEVIRLFEPDVYRTIARSKELLTEGRDGGLGGEPGVREKQAAITKILDAGATDLRESIREIMTQLFPRTEWAFGGSNYGSDWEDRWLRELRVCSPDIFNRYFHFAIPEGDLPQIALDRLLAAAGDRDALRSGLQELGAQGLLGVAMDRLDTYKETVPLEHAVPFITALFDIGEVLPEDRGGLSGISPELHAYRVVYWYLRRTPDVAQRAEVLRAAIQATDGLYLPTLVVSREDDRQSEGGDAEKRLVSDASLAELRGLCVAKFRAAAGDGRLGTNPHLAYLLYRWKEWAGEEEARVFSEELTRTSEGAVRLVTTFLLGSRAQGVQDFVARERWYIRLGDIEQFVRWEVIEEHLKSVPLESLAQRERRAVEAFRVAVRRRRQGKPDADGFRLPEDDEA